MTNSTPATTPPDADATPDTTFEIAMAHSRTYAAIRAAYTTVCEQYRTTPATLRRARVVLLDTLRGMEDRMARLYQALTVLVNGDLDMPIAIPPVPREPASDEDEAALADRRKPKASTPPATPSTAVVKATPPLLDATATVTPAATPSLPERTLTQHCDTLAALQSSFRASPDIRAEHTLALLFARQLVAAAACDLSAIAASRHATNALPVHTPLAEDLAALVRPLSRLLYDDRGQRLIGKAISPTENAVMPHELTQLDSVNQSHTITARTTHLVALGTDGVRRILADN